MIKNDRLDLLMTEARTGNEAAYREFLSEAAKRLRAVLARKIGADADLEDLVQESLIALHQKRHTLDPNRPVGPWMNAIAKYKLIDHWRKKGRSPLVNVEADLPVAADEFANMDIAALLGKLPHPQAEAIRLTHIEGLTGQEASERIGIGHSALKLRVHRGMAKLKKFATDSELAEFEAQPTTQIRAQK